MIQRLFALLMLAGLALPSTGCHCLSQVFCCDSMMTVSHGCSDCGGAGCASCGGGCDSCGGAGCASCGGGCDSCGGAGCNACGGHDDCCFPLLSGLVDWIFHPCTGCESIYSDTHGSPWGCDSCDDCGNWTGHSAPYQAPYNINPYMEMMPQGSEMIVPEQIEPTPAAGSMSYRAPNSAGAYQVSPAAMHTATRTSYPASVKAGSTYR